MELVLLLALHHFIRCYEIEFDLEVAIWLNGLVELDLGRTEISTNSDQLCFKGNFLVTNVLEGPYLLNFSTRLHCRVSGYVLTNEGCF